MFNRYKKRSKLEERFDKAQKGYMASLDKDLETKSELRKEKRMGRKWERLKGKLDKMGPTNKTSFGENRELTGEEVFNPNDQYQPGYKKEPVVFKEGRTLTSAEVWKKPTLGGMKRDYFSEDRKAMRAAAAAGRAFRKGKMS